jgi:hypothetical protein
MVETTGRLCSFPGCPNPHKSRGFCTGHWKQQHDGRPLAVLRKRNKARNGMKFCAACGETKPVDEFYKKLNYVQEMCRPCRNVKLRAEAYGLTVEEVHRMLARSACECCGAEFASVRDRHIDHDHRTSEVRGLLCQKCNTALGCVDDDVDHLRRLISYIESRR